ncbi:hypothetical protein ADUPG1_009449 [Aduncisulcus paluster]|uniref:Uncharacterized protein n=1 Tax=Aduncisulcus paluster TaxID=2918883 RepID=A0ABQ5KZL5_9EUKA|nr:hypothetical protein ADUPG1_009449 [Aduncisulcus paluster]
MPVFHSDKIQAAPEKSDVMGQIPMTIGSSQNENSEDLKRIIRDQQVQIDELKNGMDKLIEMMKSMVTKQSSKIDEVQEEKAVHAHREEIFSAETSSGDGLADSAPLPPLKPPVHHSPLVFGQMRPQELADPDTVSMYEPAPPKPVSGLLSFDEPPVLNELNDRLSEVFLKYLLVLFVRRLQIY